MYTIEFKCPKCGCLTPGMAEVPERVPDKQKINVSIQCFHCDEMLYRTIKARDIRSGKAANYRR